MGKKEAKADIISDLRKFLLYKKEYITRSVCIMTTSGIDHYIVHFDVFEEMQNYLNVISSIYSYDIKDKLDYQIFVYLANIIGPLVYNQYDVLLYKKVISKIDKFNKVKYDMDLGKDKDILELITGDINPEDVIMIMKFSL